MRLKVFIVLVVALLVGWIVSGQGLIIGQPVKPLSSSSGFTSDCGTVPVTRGLVQWICAKTFFNLGVANDAVVTNWPDSGPLFSNHLYRTNPFGGMQDPTFKTNSGIAAQPYAVLFGDAGSGSAMANSNAWFSGLPSAELIMVAKRSFSASDAGWMTMGSSGQDNFWYSGGTPNTFSDFGSTVRKNAGNLDFKSTNIFRVYLSTTNGSWTLYTNGATAAFTTAVNTVGWPTDASQALYGYSLPSGYPSGLHIFEVLAYTNILTSGERSSIDAWLATKYP